jgi:hypothetical protein
MTTSVLEANVRPTKALTAARIKEVIDDAYRENGQNYEGHDLDDISRLHAALASK